MFLGADEDTSGGHRQKLREQFGHASEGGDVLEPTVGEQGALEPLGRGLPAQLTVEPVVVVVGRVGRITAASATAKSARCWRSRTSAWRMAQKASTLPLVQGVSTWVRNMSQVFQLGERALEAARASSVRWPRRACRCRSSARGGCRTARSPRPGRRGPRAPPARDRPDAQQVAAVVIDERHEVAGADGPCLGVQVEGALEVDVPQLVGGARS